MTTFVPIEAILEYMDREYCTCGTDHGFFSHDESPDDIWCKDPECAAIGDCNDKINWGVRRSIREIHRSRVVLKSRSVTYRHGKLYEMIDMNESRERKEYVWK